MERCKDRRDDCKTAALSRLMIAVLRPAPLLVLLSKVALPGCAYSSSFRHRNDFRFILSLYFFYAIIYIIYMRRDGYNSGCDGYNFGEYIVIILGRWL